MSQFNCKRCCTGPKPCPPPLRGAPGAAGSREHNRGMRLKSKWLRSLSISLSLSLSLSLSFSSPGFQGQYRPLQALPAALHTFGLTEMPRFRLRFSLSLSLSLSFSFLAIRPYGIQHQRPFTVGPGVPLSYCRFVLNMNAQPLQPIGIATEDVQTNGINLQHVMGR